MYQFMTLPVKDLYYFESRDGWTSSGECLYFILLGKNKVDAIKWILDLVLDPAASDSTSSLVKLTFMEIVVLGSEKAPYRW